MPDEVLPIKGASALLKLAEKAQAGEVPAFLCSSLTRETAR